MSVLAHLTTDSGVEGARLLRALRQGYGRSLPTRLRSHPLVNIGAETCVSLWNGHSSGKSLFKINFEEMASAILRAGLMTEAEFEADMRRLDQMDFIMPSSTMWTDWGQAPEIHTNNLEMLANQTSISGADRV